MKKVFAVFLLLILTATSMGGCENNSISQEVDFSNVDKLSFITPDEKEIFLDDNHKETVIDILSNADYSGESGEIDGGIWIRAYSGDKTEYNITVYDANHISFSTDSRGMYKISESDYKIINELYQTNCEKK
ncbi:MAG: hypothetical protein ACI4HL_00530 [Ruminococcus sp.]